MYMASLCKNLRFARHGARYISHGLCAMRKFSSNSPLQTRPHLQAKSDQSRSARIFHQFKYLLNKFTPFHYIAPHETGVGDGINFLVHTDTFSRLEKHEIDRIETPVFDAAGYKWKLKFYIDDGKDGKTVPVNLALADPSALPENWKLDAFFSIYFQNQAPRCYFSVLGKVCFDATKTEWGGFVPKHFLTNPAYGYLKNDTCVFGAEVEVLNENMALKNVRLSPIIYMREFKIRNFPSPKEGCGWVTHQTWTSQIFEAGDHKWMLKVSPNRRENGIGHLSFCLENFDDFNEDYFYDSSDQDSDDSSDEDSYDHNSLVGIKAIFSLTLKSQNGEDVVKVISSEGDQWGWHSIVDHASLHDPDKGFILNGCVNLLLELSVEEVEF